MPDMYLIVTGPNLTADEAIAGLFPDDVEVVVVETEHDTRCNVHTVFTERKVVT